jgi:predicted PurR-regulated permease PerM
MTNQPKNSAKNNFFSQNRWLILLFVLCFVVYLLLPILSPFLIAAILSYLCDPLVDRISEYHFPFIKLSRPIKVGRTLATVAVMTGIALIFTLLVLIVTPLFQKESQLIAERLPDLMANTRSSVEPWLQQYLGIRINIDAAQIQDIIAKNWKTAGGLFGGVLMSAGNQGMALIGVLANLLLLPVVLFYMLRDWDGFIASVGQLVPRDSYDAVLEIAKEIDQVLAEFLRGQFAVMLALSIFYAAGLWLIGLDMALPIGLVAGLLSFVPYLGMALGLGLALLVAALQFTSLAQVVPVLMVFGAGQLIEGMWLTPKLVGDRIGLHPVIVIFALMAGGQLFGFTGILLALPVSAAMAVGLRHTKKNYLKSDAYLK